MFAHLYPTRRPSLIVLKRNALQKISMRLINLHSQSVPLVRFYWYLYLEGSLYGPFRRSCLVVVVATTSSNTIVRATVTPSTSASGTAKSSDPFAATGGASTLGTPGAALFALGVLGIFVGHLVLV